MSLRDRTSHIDSKSPCYYDRGRSLKTGTMFDLLAMDVLDVINNGFIGIEYLDKNKTILS